MAAERTDPQDDESVSLQSVTAMDMADAAPSLGASAGLLAQANRRRAAEKLRDKGWSYRRISEDLNVPYILVSKWLSEDPLAPAAKPVAPAPAAAPRRRPRVADLEEAADTIETLKLQYDALESYVQPMLDALERANTEGDQARDQMQSRLAALEAQVARLQMEVQSLSSRSGAGNIALASGLVAAEADRAMGDSEEASEDAGADPFADSAAADPFAAAAADPFADAAADPFADSAAADPFADVAADPFAESPAADPLARTDADPLEDTVPEPAAKTLGGRLKFWKK